MRLATLAVVSLVGALSVAPLAQADGWKGPLSQYLNSNPNNNGNHFGQLSNNQNGNNGNHYGWDKNTNGQSSQNSNYTANTNGTNTNGNSVPGPDSFVLLSAGLSGLVIWRKMFAKA
jgi:hypothetical protein